MNKHKVYAYGYESSADVEAGFQFGTLGTSLWGRLATKGVFAQTMFRPLVGPQNTALNFYVAGATNIRLWIQYVTEP